MEGSPSHYVQDNYLKLHRLKQGSKSVEEYTREFEQLLLKCDKILEYSL